MQPHFQGQLIVAVMLALTQTELLTLHIVQLSSPLELTIQCQNMAHLSSIQRLNRYRIPHSYPANKKWLNLILRIL
jgi:hypothetical protein